MIKFLKDCRAGRNIQVNCGDPNCCTWQEYDGIDTFFKDEEVYASEVVLEDLTEWIDYIFID